MASTAPRATRRSTRLAGAGIEAGLETPKAEAPKRTRAASSRRTSSSVNDKSINLQTDAENSITSPKALELFHEVIGSARRRVQTAKGGTPGAAVASPLLSPRRALGDVTNATTPAKTEVFEFKSVVDATNDENTPVQAPLPVAGLQPSKGLPSKSPMSTGRGLRVLADSAKTTENSGLLSPVAPMSPAPVQMNKYPEAGSPVKQDSASFLDAPATPSRTIDESSGSKRSSRTPGARKPQKPKTPNTAPVRRSSRRTAQAATPVAAVVETLVEVESNSPEQTVEYENWEAEAPGVVRTMVSSVISEELKSDEHVAQLDAAALAAAELASAKAAAIELAEARAIELAAELAADEAEAQALAMQQEAELAAEKEAAAQALAMQQEAELAAEKEAAAQALAMQQEAELAAEKEAAARVEWELAQAAIVTVIDAEQDDGSEAVVALAEAACPEKSPSLRELRRQVSDAYESSRGRWNDINRLLGEDPADGVFEDGEGERDFEFLEPAMGEVGTTRRLLSAVATVLEAPVEDQAQALKQARAAERKAAVKPAKKKAAAKKAMRKATKQATEAPRTPSRAISSSTEEGLTSRVHLRGEAVPDGIHTRFDEATGVAVVSPGAPPAPYCTPQREEFDEYEYDEEEAWEYDGEEGEVCKFETAKAPAPGHLPRRTPLKGMKGSEGEHLRFDDVGEACPSPTNGSMRLRGVPVGTGTHTVFDHNES